MSQRNDFESPSIAVFTGNANPALALEITRHLRVPLGRAHVGRFSDGEVNVGTDGERARPRRLHHPADLPAGERQPDGAA